MRDKGVFGQSLVKPRGRGWLFLVPGKYINEDFDGEPIGHCETLEQVTKCVQFLIHCLKEEKYVSKIVSFHGAFT